jgi:hypothetical protein
LFITASARLPTWPGPLIPDSPLASQ